MPFHPVAATIDKHGCSIALRRVEGPHASELFLHCRPPVKVAGPGAQAEAIYRTILEVLEAEGGGFGAVVSEMIFLRDVRQGIESVREARDKVLVAHGATTNTPATIEIEQHPLDERACLEVSVHALLAKDSSTRIETIKTAPACPCAECARVHGLRVELGGEIQFHAAGLCAPGATAYEQTLGMFRLAEDLLRQAGIEFRDVVRTWIHIRDIDRDYAELNRARREFFRARGIDPVPASTGIGGGPVSEEHHLCLGVYAVKAPVRTVMTSPTLNEAPQYGADFVRGMRVVESNKDVLLISGTASIDERGATVHVGDFEAQADRMLVNVAALLARQGASFGDVVSAITYLKHPADASRLREKLQESGFVGFPHALVAAPVCRPELLCETEAVAVLTQG